MCIRSTSCRALVATIAFCLILGSAVSLRAHDDQPADAQLKAAREKVDQQLRSIKERVAQLEKDGRHEEAQRLMAAGGLRGRAVIVF